MRRTGKPRLTLRPGDPGTKRYTREYPDTLVAVRYRYDERTWRRYTTVELIVDESPWVPEKNVRDPMRLVGLRVGYQETELRAKLRSAQARWDPDAKLWWLPFGIVAELGLEERIAAWAPPRGKISTEV